MLSASTKQEDGTGIFNRSLFVGHVIIATSHERYNSACMIDLFVQASGGPGWRASRRAALREARTTQDRRPRCAHSAYADIHSSAAALACAKGASSTEGPRDRVRKAGPRGPKGGKVKLETASESSDSRESRATDAMFCDGAGAQGQEPAGPGPARLRAST